jgi:geranylgeranyl pyrophosphate synthase
VSLATIRESPGLDAYLDGLEERLAAAVDACPGLVATVGAEALAAGGKRLRPLLVFLTAPQGADALAAGAAVELVHTATLVHDDLIDRAEYRRGRASAWACHGPAAARAAGDYLFARAFAELADTGDHQAVGFLAGATLALARGEALQRAQTRDPETSVESYLDRCALKTGKLFEAACLLGSRGDRGLGEFGLALGIAFQIADDILDCSGETIETGKIAGTDLREGTPTLPLILAAREDESVRSALAGGPLDGALIRVAETGALDGARVVALQYAQRARDCLDGNLRREELEALTDAVVDRES